MIWNSVGEFLAMGGYAGYVWGSIGACALGLAVEVWQTRRGRAQALQQVQQEHLARTAGQEWQS